MSENQAKIVQLFRHYAAIQGASVNHLTDEQVLEMAQRFIDRVMNTFDFITNNVPKIIESFLKGFATLEAARKIDRRLYYRKKRSQAKRKA